MVRNKSVYKIVAQTIPAGRLSGICSIIAAGNHKFCTKIIVGRSYGKVDPFVVLKATLFPIGPCGSTVWQFRKILRSEGSCGSTSNTNYVFVSASNSCG